MAWNTAQAAEATEAAAQELTTLLAELTPEQAAGVQRLGAWWLQWYNGASGLHPTGHKALARLFCKQAKEI